MADPEFTSDEQLEHMFETDRSFTEESAAASLGRLCWMRSRLEAEFVLTLFDLGVEQSKIPAIFEAFAEAGADYYDFVRSGFDMTRDDERKQHPQEEALFEVTDELMDTIDIVDGKSVLESHIFKGGDSQMLEFGSLSTEDIFHHIYAQIRRLEAKQSE